MDDKKINDENLYADTDSDDEDLYAEKISLEKPREVEKEVPRPKTFHSKRFIDSETQAEEEKLQSTPPKIEIKQKLTHAETSGVAISAIMLVYSLAEGDKPLFFLSTSLLTFLLRPIIGKLFGKHNRAVQNALHSFSIVLFIGAILILFTS